MLLAAGAGRACALEPAHTPGNVHKAYGLQTQKTQSFDNEEALSLGFNSIDQELSNVCD
eukprot:m.88833 g.88833  ORF g.88833 m.88833 type:complete len:59 (+) comp14836_c0_seq1:839-1015(+)